MSVPNSKISCLNCRAMILPSTAEKNDGLCAPCKKALEKAKDFARHEATPGCPSCDGQNYIAFNWQRALERKGDKIDKYLKYIKKESTLKSGYLYHCSVCNGKWYLDSMQEIMSVIEHEMWPLVNEWNHKVLLPSAEVLKVAQSIGATPPDIYGNGKKYVQVPCEVHTKNNEVFKVAVLCFQKDPPIEKYRKTVRLLDEVESIYPSEYALPASVRVATSQAEEVRMCYSPTLVKTPDNTVISLNGVTNFINVNGLRGKDISLTKIVTDEPSTVYSNESCEVAYFIGDWFPHAERLRLK